MRIKKLNLIIVLTTLLLSCSEQEKNPNIQDIVSLWTEIEKSFTADTNLAEKDLIENIDIFYLLIQKFEKSELYHTYSAIPFSPLIRRSFDFYPPTDIQEVHLISDLVLIFRDSIVNRNLEQGNAASAEISGILIRLLIIDADTQRYISSSYFQLLFTLIGFIAITALLIWILYQSLIRSLKREEEGTAFSHAHILAQEEERGRISRELHDTIIQDMRYLLLETEKIGSTDEKNEREKLTVKTVPMMAALIRKTRDICNSLIPPDFRFSELPDAIRQLCLDFGERTGIDCRAEIDENITLSFLSMEKRLQVFRIIQEALTNIEKHSGAKVAIVTMRTGQNRVVFIGISDDGIGFNSPLDNRGKIISSIGKSHIGIISMKERAAILGGSFKINTAEDEGTLVCLEIPFNNRG